MPVRLGRDGLHPGEQPAQQKRAGQVQMPDLSIPRRIDQCRGDVGDGAQVREHRSIAVWLEQMDGGAGGHPRIDQDVGNVDPGRPHDVQHQMAKQIVAHDAGIEHAQPQAGRRRSHDRGRATAGDDDVIDQLFHLTKGGNRVAAHQDVDVQLADHKQVIGSRGHRSPSRCRASGSPSPRCAGGPGSTRGRWRGDRPAVAAPADTVPHVLPPIGRY